MRPFYVVLILLLLFIPITLPAAQLPITEYKLDNGLKVLVIEDHKAPLAVFQIWYRVGSKDEPAGKKGISHVLEHMMFKGTPKYGSKEFSNIIQRNGGSDNAFTSKDYTVYFQTMAADRIGLSIELESDRMSDLLLEPKEITAESNVVMEERRMRYEDDPQNLLYEEVLAAAFKAHPYHTPVIGWTSDLASIKRNDLLAYYTMYYAPDNAFIIVSGDVYPEKVIAQIKKQFGPIPSAKEKAIRNPTIEPVQRGGRRVYLEKEAELPYMIMAHHVPTFPHKESAALEVLAGLLTDGRSSRLYRTLVYEKKLAINAFGDYSGLSKDPFLFMLGATAAPGIKIEEVEQALIAEIEKIKKEPPAAREVQKAKNQIEAAFIFAQDSNYSKALYAGMFEFLGNWKLMDAYLDAIRKVTSEDVQAVAKKYLTNENRTVGILIPLKEQK